MMSGKSCKSGKSGKGMSGKSGKGKSGKSGKGKSGKVSVVM